LHYLSSACWASCTFLSVAGLGGGVTTATERAIR